MPADIQQPVDYVREDDTTHSYDELPPIHIGKRLWAWLFGFLFIYAAVVGVCVWVSSKPLT